MATGLAIVAAIGAVAGAVEQRKISKAQRRQNRLTNKIAAITRQRNIKRSIATSRIQVAQQQALGFQLGVSGGTAVEGARAGVISDVASTIGASNLQFTGATFISGLQDEISRAQQAQAGFGAVTSIAGGLAGNEQAVAALTGLVG